MKYFVQWNKIIKEKLCVVILKPFINIKAYICLSLFYWKVFTDTLFKNKVEMYPTSRNGAVVYIKKEFACSQTLRVCCTANRVDINATQSLGSKERLWGAGSERRKLNTNVLFKKRVDHVKLLINWSANRWWIFNREAIPCLGCNYMSDRSPVLAVVCDSLLYHLPQSFLFRLRLTAFHYNTVTVN